MRRNVMKRYGGCISPTERRERACEDEDKATERKLPFFRLLNCGVLQWTVEWRAPELNSGERLEQPSGTKQATGERPLDCSTFN